MKKLLYFAVVALVITMVLPNLSMAQTLNETVEATAIGTSLQSPEAVKTPVQIREKLRTDSKIQNIKTNAKINEEVRAEMIKERSESFRNGDGIVPRFSSSTATTTKKIIRKEEREEKKEEREIKKEEKKEEREIKKEERKEKRDNVRKEIFEKQKEKLLKELNRSMENLKQIRERAANRIKTAETNGRNMTEAKTALAKADIKMTEARKAINDLAALKPDPRRATSTPDTATTTDDGSDDIDLSKPRQVGAVAIKAVAEARKALNDTVIAIAHSLGFRIGTDGKIERGTSTTTGDTSTTTGRTN